MDGQWVGKKVCITGGAGFIGSNLARRLADQGADVIAVDSLIPEYGGNLYNLFGYESAIKLNLSDIRDRYSLRAIVKNADVVYALAGQTSHLDSMADPLVDIEINCNAQLSLLEILREVNPRARIVYASTRQIYGAPKFLPVNETHPIQPVDCNGISKYAAELYYKLYSKLYQMKCITLRLTNTIGPRMRIKDARQTFVGVWIRNILLGTPIQVWGGEQLRDINDIDDVVDAFLLAGCLDTKLSENIFNLGGSSYVSLNNLAQLLVGIYGSGSIEYIEYPCDRKQIDIGNYYGDYSQFQAATGWAPKVQLYDSLEKILCYYKCNYTHYL